MTRRNAETNRGTPDDLTPFSGFDPEQVPSPAFVVDQTAVQRNLAILRTTADRAEARVLVALKAFALPAVFGLIGRYLDGACASGPYEARLAREELGACADRPWQVHTFAPAYTKDDLRYLRTVSDHVTFNSLTQYVRLVTDDVAGETAPARRAPSRPMGFVSIRNAPSPNRRYMTPAHRIRASESPATS